MSVPPVAVLDTNVLVSGLFPRSSTPRRVLERLREGAFTVAISPELLGEVLDVVTRPAIRRLVSTEATEALLDNLREDALLVQPAERPRLVLADPDDDALFACALAAGAKWLVSGDKSVLSIRRFRDIRIVSPAKFLSWLRRRA